MVFKVVVVAVVGVAGIDGLISRIAIRCFFAGMLVPVAALWWLIRASHAVSRDALCRNRGRQMASSSHHVMLLIVVPLYPGPTGVRCLTSPISCYLPATPLNIILYCLDSHPTSQRGDVVMRLPVAHVT